MWRILIENSSVSVILHSIFVVFLPDLLSSRLYFLPQTWPAQCDCELKSSGILYTHLYSIYCSTKIYDFSSQFPSEAAWPFWRQREKPICPGSPQSPDVKSSSSVQRASSFVSSRKLEILWRILPSRKTQDFFSALRVFPDCVSKGKGKGWAQTNQTRTQLNKTTTFRSNAPPNTKQNKARQNKMPRQWSLWQKTPETYSAKSCVTPRGTQMQRLWPRRHPHRCRQPSRGPLSSHTKRFLCPLLSLFSRGSWSEGSNLGVNPGVTAKLAGCWTDPEGYDYSSVCNANVPRLLIVL